MNAPISLGWIIVHKGDGDMIGTEAVEHLPTDSLAGITGTHDEDTACGLALRTSAGAAKKEEPAADSHATHQQHS
jgi:hypothetical protein